MSALSDGSRRSSGSAFQAIGPADRGLSKTFRLAFWWLSRHAACQGKWKRGFLRSTVVDNSPFWQQLLFFENGLLPVGVWQSYDRHVKAGMKKSAAAGESGEGRGTAGSGTGWSLTLSGSATGQPAEWTIAEAKLAPELKGSRREMIERMIRDTTVANLNTTNHSADEVQRGFELYAAINDSNSVSDDDGIRAFPLAIFPGHFLSRTFTLPFYIV